MNEVMYQDVVCGLPEGCKMPDVIHERNVSLHPFPLLYQAGIQVRICGHPSGHENDQRSHYKP